jgi:hypothetical protein
LSQHNHRFVLEQQRLIDGITALQAEVALREQPA